MQLAKMTENYSPNFYRLSVKQRKSLRSRNNAHLISSSSAAGNRLTIRWSVGRSDQKEAPEHQELKLLLCSFLFHPVTVELAMVMSTSEPLPRMLPAPPAAVELAVEISAPTPS